MATEVQPGQKFTYDRPFTGGPALSQEVRDNFEALARTNITDDATYPAAPRGGMFRIFNDPGPPTNAKFQWYDGATWRTLIQRIEGGGVGTASITPTRLAVDFTSALTTWSIDHNLGAQPLVQVFDALWNQLQVVPPGPVVAGQYLLVHSTENRVVVTHPGPITGHVVIIG